MDKANEKKDSIITPEFRVSYPNVFKPRINTLSNKEEYSLTALFKKGQDLTVLKKAVESAATKKWGPDKAKWPKKLRTPFRDQADREKELDDGSQVMPEGYVKGAIFLNLKTTKRPAIVDKDAKTPIFDAEDFYGGCWARASVFPFAYEQAGNAGVSFYVNNIQKVRDDDPFSGRKKAEEEFTAIEEDASNTDDPFAA